MRFIRAVVFWMLVLLFGGVLFVEGFWLGGRSAVGEEGSWRLLDAGFQQIARRYVDPAQVDRTSLEREALRGMIAALGDGGHTRYLTPNEVQRSAEALSDHYEGVGLQLSLEDGLYAVSPTPGGPADRAGIRAGDILLAVDGVRVEGLPPAEVSDRVRGPAGSEVALAVRHADGAEETLRIVRARVTSPLASAGLVADTGVGVVRLTSMAQGAADQMRARLDEVRPETTRGLVVDLRNNPGGYLDQGIAVASLFVGEGEIAWQVRRDGEREPVRARPGQVAYTGPLVVLVNSRTGSAAELLAGALRDRRAATVVGERTAGAGTILEQVSLYDGSAILLATAFWQTPSGQAIWKVGITPDVVVTLPAGARELAPTALDRIADRAELAATDPQLAQAVALLAAPAP